MTHAFEKWTTEQIQKKQKNPGRDVRKAEQLIHSSVLWLQNQMIEFNLKRHGNSGKSPSNNNEGDNTSRYVCLTVPVLKCFVIDVIVEML